MIETTPTLRSQLRYIVLAPVLGFVLIATFLTIAIWQLQSAARWVDHTDEVIANATQLQRMTLDEETGLRGFLLTGDPILLDSYNKATAQFDSEYDRLVRLTADNPAQQARLQELARQYREWHDFAAWRISQRQIEPLRDPGVIRGKQGMDSMRATFASFLGEEEVLKRRRSVHNERVLRIIFALLALALLVGAAGLVTWLRSRLEEIHAAHEARVDALAAAQREVSATRERFDLVTRASQLGIWFCDLPFDELIWDERVKGHFFVPANEKVTIDLFYQRIHPDDRERTRKAIEKSIADHTRYDIRYRTVNPADHEDIKWIRAIGNTFYADDGTPRRFDGVTLDVTEEVTTATELSRRTAELQALLANAPIGFAFFDREHRFVRVNENLAEINGIPVEAHKGHTIQELLPVNAVAVDPLLDQVIATGRPVTLEITGQTPRQPGITRHWLTSFYPVSDGEHAAAMVGATVVEITERKRMEQALRQRESELRERAELMDLAQAATQAGFWHYMPRTGTCYLSAGVQRIFGLPMADRVHVSRLLERVHPEDRDSVKAAFDVGMEQGEYRSEFRVLDENGAVRWLSGRGRMLQYSDGEKYMVGINADITRQKQSEEALRKSEKLALVGRLAATISHEINNPLEAVTNLLYLIRTGTGENETRDLSALAEQELARVTHIVTHTLRFNRHSNIVNDVKLSEIMESSVAIYGRRIQQSGVELLERFRDERAVSCYSAELRQVFSNLLGNAFDATRAGQKIYLRTTQQSDGIRVTVADTGVGMDRKTQGHLFEPFFSTKGNNGTGLGLWVSKEILDKHGAKLRIKSRLGVGSVFSMFFPYRQGESSAETASAALSAVQ